MGGSLGFLVLRDQHGVTQVVFETEDMMAQVKALNKESVVSVTGAVRAGRVYGAQFHPEKSGDTGLRILKAFSEL